jgi:sortase (surface protein transpeptidase)
MTSLPRTTAARAARTWGARATVVGLVLAIASCSDGDPRGAMSDGPEDAGGGTPRHSAAATGHGSAVRFREDVPVRPAQDAPPPPQPAPVRVVVPALDIDVPVRATGVDDAGRMALHGSADVAGWYRFGSAPASPAGATVVAAHVDDDDGVGPFARLVRAEVGTNVRVRTTDGTTHNYTVTGVRAEAKRAMSPDDLFDRSGEPRLVLVTCGGDWDPEARSYTKNVVVTGVPRQ